jgi:hypothetical protein
VLRPPAGSRPAAAARRTRCRPVSEDTPAPAVLHDSLTGDQGRTEAEDPPDLGVQAGRAQIQVQPVLLALAAGHRLHEHPDALAAFRYQAPARPAGHPGQQ